MTEQRTRWLPGMSALTGGAPVRVLSVSEGMFLEEGDCVELLVARPDDAEKPYWVNAVYATVDTQDILTRSLLAWQTYCSRLHSSFSSTTSSPSSAASSPALDIGGIRERIAGSMTGHPTDACWRVYTHAERDILALCDEVEGLRARLRG